MALFLSSDVIKRFRSEVNDLLNGPSEAPDNDALWKEWEVQVYLDAATAETSRRGRMLVKHFRLEAPFATGPFYKLPGNYIILDVNSAYSINGRRKLDELNLGQNSYYRDDYGMPITAGYPESRLDYALGYYRDYDTSGILLSPRTTRDDVINFVATVEVPSVPCGAPMPFTDEADIALVILWMKKMAYSKRDADTFDSSASSNAESDFNRLILDRRYDALRRRRTAGTVRYSW